MLREMSWAQFSEWLAYAEIDPIGSWREDFRAAQVAATVINMNRSSKTKAVKITDLMPDFNTKKHGKKKAAPLTSSDDWGFIKAMAKATHAPPTKRSND